MLYDITFYYKETPVKQLKNIVADSKTQAFDIAERFYTACKWDFSYSDIIAELQTI